MSVLGPIPPIPFPPEVVLATLRTARTAGMDARVTRRTAQMTRRESARVRRRSRDLELTLDTLSDGRRDANS